MYMKPIAPSMIAGARSSTIHRGEKSDRGASDNSTIGMAVAEKRNGRHKTSGAMMRSAAAIPTALARIMVCLGSPERPATSRTASCAATATAQKAAPRCGDS